MRNSRIEQIILGLCVLAVGFLGCAKKSTEPVESIPPATISNLKTIDPTYNSITLTWTTPVGDSVSSAPTQYDIRYAEFAITDSTWDSATAIADSVIMGAPSEADTFAVSGLDSAITYYFAAKTGDTEGNWSAVSNAAVDSTIYEIRLSHFPMTVGSWWKYVKWAPSWCWTSMRFDTMLVNIVAVNKGDNGSRAITFALASYSRSATNCYDKDTITTIIANDTLYNLHLAPTGCNENVAFPLAIGRDWWAVSGCYDFPDVYYLVYGLKSFRWPDRTISQALEFKTLRADNLDSSIWITYWIHRNIGIVYYHHQYVWGAPTGEIECRLLDYYIAPPPQ